MPSERVQRRIDRLLDQAEEAADARDWTTVAESARMVLDLDPENVDAQSFLSMVQQADSPPTEQSGEVAEANAQSADTPTSFANGRYQVTGFLGEGGKKKVYLVHDTTLDRDVAFGLIKTEGLDDASRQRVTREAQAMGRLGDNPNIMPIHDLGEENGQTYMVQPLMAGGDVETLIAESENGRLSFEDALRIASEICRGLEFAHSKSIIHRDLKPGNVWLTEDGTARIGDFGLAISLDRSRLTQEKMMVGTVSYMPPEQATGGEVTPRADLYSLGAMLYEMTTGRPPFLGDDDIAIIGQHINTPPVAPSWHNPSLPQTLDSIIMRLLSKDPAERPKSAAELLQALEAIDPSEAAAAHEEEGSLDSMSGGVFVGRHREMDQLKSIFEDTLGGRGGMVALVGEPGIGKTRTAQELATYATMRGGQVLWGRCYEGGGAPPYWPWVQAIRTYVMDRDAETVRREMGSTASVIAEIVPDVIERLPDVQAPVQIDEPESAQFRLFDSITTFLKTASSAQPIVLMLEDLHWSDRPSLTLLEFVARELSNSRLMIIGNYRDMELNRRHPLSVTLGELSRERLFDRVLLRGLQKHDVRRFIEVAAGIDPPSALVDAVYTQTEGNPLFVTETVRLLIQEGDISSGTSSGGGTSSWEVRIPEGVREVIGRRLDRLSEQCNEVLAIAGVMGRQFRFGVLISLMEGFSENTLLDALDEALDARIVEENSSEVGLYQFTHALMQETLTAELPINRRVRLSARIAQALIDHYGDDADQNASEIAGHLMAAESIVGPEMAREWATKAGDTAFSLRAWGEARQWYEAALGFWHDPVIGQDFLRIRARFLIAVFGDTERPNLDAHRADVNETFDQFIGIGDIRGAASFAAESTLSFFFDTDRILAALDECEPDTLEKAQLHYVATHKNSHSDEAHREAQKHAREALRIAALHDDGAFEAKTLMHWAHEEAIAISHDVSLEFSERATKLFTRFDQPHPRAHSEYEMASIYLARGQTDLASEHVEAAIANADRSGVRWWRCLSRTLKAELLAATGRFDEAEGQGLASSELSESEAIGTGRLALVYMARGEIEKGCEMLRPLLEKVHDQLAPGDGPRSTLSIAVPLVAFRYGIDLGLEVVSQFTREDASDDRAGMIRVREAKAGLLLTAAWRNDTATLEELVDDPLLKREPFISHGLLLSTYWIRAQAAWKLGAVDDAAKLLATAIEHCTAAGFKAELCEFQADLARLLIDRDAPGDRTKATELQDEAIAIAQELGMKPLLERVLAQREILKA